MNYAEKLLNPTFLDDRVTEAAIILNADDYGMSAGISTGIEDLAFAGRLSAVSALVTLPEWPQYAARLAGLRKHVAMGLHVNLTLGAPIGSMPNFAPSGTFPPLADLLFRCFCKNLNEDEVAAEIYRQISRFEDHTGYSPDVIDGHQHVHVLPGVRTAFLRALAARSLSSGVLVRDPSDSVFSICSRGRYVGKALTLRTLALGFGAAVRRAGFITNFGFAGVSAFDERISVAREFRQFFFRPGPIHLVMCHPGRPDSEPKSFDPIVGRRIDEFEYLLGARWLPQTIWHVARDEQGWPLWPKIPNGIGAH